jgi:GPH family glycoside/pentoside/hexuronide:cation symporter
LVAGAFCFIPIPNAAQWVKILVYVFGYVLWDAFYTIANVPYGSILSLVSEDSGDRAQLSTWRSFGGLVGQVLTMTILPILIYDAKDNIRGNRVFFIALLMGAIGFLAFSFMLKKITLRVDESSAHLRNTKIKFNAFKAIKNFCKNRAALGATIAAMAGFLGMQSATTATTVLFQSYFHNVQVSGIAALIGFLPMFLFMPFIRKIVNKWGKQEASIIGSLVSVLGGVLLVALPITPNNMGIALYIFAMIVFGLGMGIYQCVSWSLMADAIDYHEWKNGSREEGTVYSLHSFFRKLAQGIGPSAVLLIMAGLGYVGANEGNQTMQVATNMRWLVAGLYLFSGVVMFIGLALIYNLNVKKLKSIQNDLNDRRKKQNPSKSIKPHSVLEDAVRAERVLEENKDDKQEE